MAKLNVNVKSAKLGTLVAVMDLSNLFSFDKYSKINGEIAVNGKKYYCYVTYASAEKKNLLYLAEFKGNEEYSNFHADFKVPKGYKPAMHLENPNAIEEAILNGYDYTNIEVHKTNTGLPFTNLFVWNHAAQKYLMVNSVDGASFYPNTAEKIFTYLKKQSEKGIEVPGFEKTEGTYHYDGYEFPTVMKVKFSLEAYKRIYPILYAKKVEREAHINACIQEARETGKRVLISQYTGDSADYSDEEESSTCTVYVWALPDGTTEETVNHHY